MKKLELKQMEKVNGGGACERYKRRFLGYAEDGNGSGKTRMYNKAVAAGCDYSK
ncbi:hypothetical protein [Labilibaculum manganireducens]|uniref:hypothetical protein n=1 Tax=Labilibaculum manganireducens TaxID=1940525 RepID=UPI0029F5B8F8|nr:hypothetical protein [Labilibaculum manganireducens]